MKPFHGYKAEKATARGHLPAGSYVAKIKGAKGAGYSWGKVLAIPTPGDGDLPF